MKVFLWLHLLFPPTHILIQYSPFLYNILPYVSTQFIHKYPIFTNIPNILTQYSIQTHNSKPIFPSTPSTLASILDLQNLTQYPTNNQYTIMSDSQSDVKSSYVNIQASVYHKGLK